MIFQKTAFVTLGMSLLLAGCVNTEIKQEQASQREDIRGMQDKLDKLQSDIVSVQSENDALKTQVSNLKEDLATSNDTNDQYKKDISRLDDLIKKLDSARDQDRKIIVDEVSSEISRLSKKIQTVSTPTPAPKSPAVVEEGVEHTVSKGETLLAIAKAYGVTMKQIREANKLNTDSLKVGQKLFIPQKAKK
jgi:LysM repeat protein